MTTKKHMQVTEMPEILMEHTQAMIKTDYLLGINESKDYPFRRCTECKMEKEKKKEFTRNSKVCNLCKRQAKCEHKRTELIRDMLECLDCMLRREPLEVRV